MLWKKIIGGKNMVSEILEYKGSPIISLKKDAEDKYGMSFGVRKARLILEHIDDIREFVEQNGE